MQTVVNHLHEVQQEMAGPARTDYALGVDIGGTFTDFALLDYRSGAIHVEKVLTNYADLAQGVFEGLDALRGTVPGSTAQLRRLVHGTTLATNALIERRGANTALVVTRGFRDLLELGRESRYDIYDIEIEVPAPLVPRRLVFEVTERLDHRGDVIEPLDENEVRGIADRLRANAVEAVAVCLLHSFVNPAHEQRVARLLRAALPGVALSLSCEVMPDIREYERASTTAANAYVQPAIKGYLDRLARGLAAREVNAPVSIITSDGGTIGCSLGLDRVIALDMGGTTAKICVLDDGKPERSTEFEVGRVFRFARGSGLPLKVPVLEMIEIGAGGGSIAHIDSLGLLRVGPQSAASSPGPACYDLGGTEPTVTDADLYLGYLDADYFLGGRMKLDRERSMRAIEDRIAGPLGLDPTRAAWGMH
ncbi:MAG: hydantoinase/oxoprolinase family protein, partial [Betaproteobacteria bacterium]|nr:hydantoinase/oxoprolinase family protein [Betaproteobacteria bacterium]